MAILGIHAIAGDTDGVDGQEEVAGAHLAPDSLARAWAKGIRPRDSLANNDGHGFFEALGDAVVTGPTLTNVNDFRAILVTADDSAHRAPRILDMRRSRNAKIVATLGPASSTEAQIQSLFDAGADVFRLNFSHGSHADHAERLRIVRKLEQEVDRPIGVLLDLQGPKLRIGTIAEGKIQLATGARWRLDMDPTPGNATRAPLLHPEIFAAVHAGAELMVDDGKVRLRVERSGPDFAETTVMVGGLVSDRKGVNVPGRGAADLAAHRERPRRPRLRARARIGLGGPVLRAASAGHRRGAGSCR